MTCDEFRGLRGNGVPTNALLAAMAAHLFQCASCRELADAVLRESDTQATPMQQLQAEIETNRACIEIIEDPEAEEIVARAYGFREKP